MVDASNKFTRRWVDHFAEKGVNFVASWTGLQLADLLLGVAAKHSSVQVSCLSRRDHMCYQGGDPKMAAYARSMRKYASCHVVGHDE